MPAFERITVSDQNGLARRTAVAAVQSLLQPFVNLREGLAEKKLTQEGLCRVDRMRAAEIQDLRCFVINLKCHVESTVHLGNGIVRIRSGFTDDKDRMHGLQRLSPPIGQAIQNTIPY